MPADDLFSDDALDAGLDLRRWVSALRRRWPLVTLCTVAGFLIGVGIYHGLPRRWEAEATLQIERKSLIPGTDTEAFWSDPWWDEEYYPTRHLLLSSRGLAERVVRSLGLASDPEFNPEGPFLESALDEPARQEVLGQLAERVLEGLSVVPVAETRLVRVLHRSGSPRLSARIANAICSEFIEWEIDNRETVAQRTSAYLADQIERLKEDLQRREAELKAREPEMAEAETVLSGDAQALLARLQELQHRYLETTSSLVLAEQRAREKDIAPPERVSREKLAPLERQLDVLKAEYDAGLERYRPTWPAMRDLQTRIRGLERRLAQERSEVVERARDLARREADLTRDQLTHLEDEIHRTREQMRALDSRALETSGLQIELETRRQLLDQLLRLLAQTDLQKLLESSNEANVRIVNRALIPQRHAEPSLRRWLTTGLGAGFALGFALLILLEMLDPRIQTAEEAEELLGLPVLGVVPDIAVRVGQQYVYRRSLGKRFGRRAGHRWQLVKTKKRTEPLSVELIPVHQPRHAISEAYRTLGGTLLQLGSEERCSFAVTSAQPSEGKTSTVANLGVVLAQLGRRVVVVDCDLRRPRLGAVFNTSNALGLAEVLQGKKPLGDALLATDIPGLSVLSSGRPPEEPWNLIASSRFDAVLLELRGRFDIVLLDTPPLLAVTDPSLIGPRVDGVVICLQAGRVTRDELRACTERLQINSSNLLGTILNRFVPTLGGGYGSYSYYYYEQGEKDDGPSSGARTA